MMPHPEEHGGPVSWGNRPRSHVEFHGRCASITILAAASSSPGSHEAGVPIPQARRHPSSGGNSRDAWERPCGISASAWERCQSAGCLKKLLEYCILDVTMEPHLVDPWGVGPISPCVQHRFNTQYTVPYGIFSVLDRFRDSCYGWKRFQGGELGPNASCRSNYRRICPGHHSHHRRGIPSSHSGSGCSLPCTRRRTFGSLL